MTAVRKLAAAGAVIGVAPLLTTLLAGPADAHGAMAGPISRTMGCGPEGGRYARSAACQAARKLSGAQALRDFDNLRVSGVNGRDRQMIPDGRLCSGGLAAFKGLDLARADWPATRLTSGAPFTFAYRETIPHQGTFKLYVTKNGYRPTRRLRWADLETRPFAVVKDPPIRGGSYVFKARLPRGKSGRHLIYTIWQTSSTPDTYYSCSDVVFTGKSAAASKTARKPAKAKKKATATPTPADSASAAGVAPDNGGTELNAANKSAHSALPLAAGGTAVVLALVAGGAVLLTRRHRGRKTAGQAEGR